MVPLETYLQAVWNFIQAALHETTLNVLSDAETHVFDLRLRTDGTWEIITIPPSSLTSSTKNDMSIPLVMPLVPIILVAHVETQWARRQLEGHLVLL